MLTSISLSYFFLAISILSIAEYLYFKLLTIKTAPDSDKRADIIGNMKDPESWRERNRRMSHVCLFWFIVSIAIFVILKFFYQLTLIPMIYLIIYAIIVLLSVILYPGIKKKASI
jgi:magnesium-transporting ATPase (P-type)